MPLRKRPRRGRKPRSWRWTSLRWPDVWPEERSEPRGRRSSARPRWCEANQQPDWKTKKFVIKMFLLVKLTTVAMNKKSWMLMSDVSLSTLLIEIIEGTNISDSISKHCDFFSQVKLFGTQHIFPCRFVEEKSSYSILTNTFTAGRFFLLLLQVYFLFPTLQTCSKTYM